MLTKRVAKNETSGATYPAIARLVPGQSVLIAGMRRERGQGLAAYWRRAYPDRDYRALTQRDGVLFTRHA